MIYKKYLFLALFFLTILSGFSEAKEEYLSIKPKPGDGIINILKRYELPESDFVIQRFKELNEGKFDKKEGILRGFKYTLPVLLMTYNGISLKSSLNINDKELIDKIARFNRIMLQSGFQEKSYKKMGVVWVPEYLLTEYTRPKEFEQPEVVVSKKPKKEKKVKVEKTENISERTKSKEDYQYPFFGEKHKKIKVKDSQLKGHIYYLDPGHGGPDPGAIGIKDGKELHEHEYAYDVTLRLAKNLLEHKAKVYVIVVDEKAGIRDEEYLKPGSGEYYYGGDTISHIQKVRLKKRSAIINRLYQENIKKAKSQQSITIHLDSRETSERTDIFFYFNEDSEKGKKLANILYSTIEEKYNLLRPGRGYNGSITSRNLLMLREVQPTSVYIELGNIQNHSDQIRFMKAGNRQAIADWLCDGLIRAVREME